MRLMDQRRDCEPDGASEDSIFCQQFTLAEYTKNHAARAEEFVFQQREDAFSQRRIFYEFGITASDSEIGFGHAQLDIADKVGKYRVAARDLAQKLFMPRSAPGKFLEGVTNAKPGGNGVAALHPAENPRDGPRSSKLRPLLRRAGREPMRAVSSSLTGVACSKYSSTSEFSAMSRR